MVRHLGEETGPERIGVEHAVQARPPHPLVGIVGRLVPKGQALAAAMKLAADVASNAPQSIRALMRMLREVDESYGEADALAKEIEYGTPIFGTKDAREGMRAFQEKRKPVYTGE